MDAHQGVASDGTYLYTVSSAGGEEGIYKRDKDGTLVDSLANPETFGTDMQQCNHVYWHENDGNLYLGSTDADPQVGESYIKVFDTDLNYIEEHQVASYINEGAQYAHGSWWAVYSIDDRIEEYDSTWTLQNTYTLSYGVDDEQFQHQGLWWEGDYLYVNLHDRTGTQRYCDVYHYDGNDFEKYTRLTRPCYNVSQGMGKEPGADTMWWAERDGLNIVKTSFNHDNGKPLGR